MSSPHDPWAKSALDVLATPVLIASASDRLVRFVNRAASNMLGPDLVGHTVGHAFGLDSDRSLTHDDGRPVSVDDNPVARAARGERVGPVELLWHGKGRDVPLVCYAERIEESIAGAAAVVVSVFDVSRFKRLMDELVRADGARDEFVRRAAHQLRTPLTTLQLRVGLARRKHSDLPDIVAVGHAVDRMAERVGQLIDVTDVREHRVTLRPEHVDFTAIVREAAHLLESEAKWAKCTVTIEPTPPIFGSWDKQRLTQVIASVVSNAVKFGAGKPLELFPRDEGARASVRVVDHGIGVSPRDRDVIFERFQRRVSAAHFGGLGLDLWIARELLFRMGGTIEVDDTPGGGATFIVRVPKVAPVNVFV